MMVIDDPSWINEGSCISCSASQGYFHLFCRKAALYALYLLMLCWSAVVHQAFLNREDLSTFDVLHRVLHFSPQSCEARRKWGADTFLHEYLIRLHNFLHVVSLTCSRATCHLASALKENIKKLHILPLKEARVNVIAGPRPFHTRLVFQADAQIKGKSWVLSWTELQRAWYRSL